jgi:hypothetical protein
VLLLPRVAPKQPKVHDHCKVIRYAAYSLTNLLRLLLPMPKAKRTKNKSVVSLVVGPKRRIAFAQNLSGSDMCINVINE